MEPAMPEPTEATVDRRREILSEAIHLVQEGGLANLTMRKVAARVGFTETAAYRYFPNKQSLLVGLADSLGDTLLGPVRALAASDLAPEERLRAILEHHIEFVLRLDGLPMLVLAEAAATGEEVLVERLNGIVDDYLALLTGVLAEMRETDESVRPRELAVLLLGIPATLAIRRRLGPDPETEKRVRTELLPFVIRCLTFDGFRDARSS